MFLIDTDCLVILQNRVQPEVQAIRQRMSSYDAGDFFVPIVSFHEITTGWNAYLNRARTSRDAVRAYQKLQAVLQDFSRVEVAPFDDGAAQQFDALKQQRVRIGTLDLRIAAIALARDLALISRNLVDFERVPGLRVEDWTRTP